MSTVLVIPDTQEPFGHQDAIPFLRRARDKFRPDYVVHLGDEVDFHALSDWDADPDGFSPGHELEEAIICMEEYYKLFPDVMVCNSNHTDRPFRKAYKMGLPKAFLKDIGDILCAPSGWEWADQWEIDSILYEHGIGFTGQTGALKAAMMNMQSTVIGHLHAFAGIQYYANKKDLVYGFNCGCLIDKDAYAFRYGKFMKSKPILGCGLIREGIPTFVPMQLNKKGRWIGRIT